MTPTIITARLNLGGRWYYTGNPYDFENDSEAADYISMGMARPRPEGYKQIPTHLDPTQQRVPAVERKIPPMPPKGHNDDNDDGGEDDGPAIKEPPKEQNKVIHKPAASANPKNKQRR